MRVLIKFKILQKTPTEIPREYIRNLIYTSIKGSRLSWMHDTRAYKHFCFSNIFSIDYKKDKLEKRKTYNIIISSPFEKVIKLVSKKLIDDGNMRLGKYNFEIVGMQFLHELKIIEKVITATPVIVRVPKKLYKNYNIESKRIYEFWDEDKYLNIFVEAIEKNSIRRYNDFIKRKRVNWKKLDEKDIPLNIFKSLNYKKTIFGWDKHFTGSLWEFKFDTNWIKSNFVKYIYDSGLGERNASSGSGFLNIIK